MELLLILSAMLSAVTGAFAGVRAPESLHRTEAAVAAMPAVPAARQAAPRALPVRPAPGPRAADVLPLPLFALAAAVPLYADRLIE